ncbi:MAG: AraC family transcriptional regulator, partial [Syntrophorhabdaceae bacterium]|nr:AraC family transcriptional regulator [Syntrophorhabdaceae bacterium]
MLSSLKGRSFLKGWEKREDALSLRSTFKNINSISDIASVNERDSYRLLKKVMAYVNENYSEALTVEKIANEVCLSPSYLTNKMRKYYDLSIVDLIGKVRIDRAKNLLKTTCNHIGSIGHEVGYSEQSYFS